MSPSADRLSIALADRYRVERELGAGGMATVYLAEDIKHRRKVALKVLRPELAAILGAERFLKEIEVTANLQHPNILPLYDSGRATGPSGDGGGELLYYVMPYVEGDSLRDKLKREKQLTVEEAVQIAKGVSAALHYAHEHGVIHRDIKPENILFQGGQAVVADFGIALAVSQAGGTRLTETGLSLGTPHYMSPEQATGDRELDARSDVYSLGAVVYEMLTGDPPHTGNTVQAIVAKVLTEAPLPIGRVRSMVPANVDAAVQRALAKAPADRFRHAGEFAAALSNPAFTLPTATAQLGPALRASSGPALAGWRLGAALAGAAVLGVAAGAMLRSSTPPHPAPVVRFSVGVRLGDVDFGPGIDISPDGTELVYIGRGPDGRPGLYRRSLGEATSTPIAGTEGFTIRYPTISPDGRSVAYLSQNRLRVTALAGGADRVLVPMSPSSGGVSWGPNDEIVFQPTFGSGLMVISARGGQPRVLTTVDSASGVDHRWPHVLPDGKRVIFTIWNGQTRGARLAAASLETGAITELLPGTFGRYTTDGHLAFVAQDGTLQLVGFDLRSGTVRGQPFAVGETIQVGTDGAAQFAVSRTGTVAYLTSLGRRVPVLVDRAGSVTPVPLEPALYLSPRFSPDGRSFAIEALNGDIWIYHLVTATFSRLTDGGGFYPLWTPRGDRILYSRDEQADVNIYSVPVDRASAPRAVLASQGQQRTQDLSPDGRHLILRQNVGAGQYDLLVLDLDSAGTLQPWLATAFLERAASFSRDGRWVAYTSDESGRDEVYVRPFPGPGGRIQVSSGGGTEPAWSITGTELFYRTAEGLHSVTVETKPTFRMVSRPTRVLGGSYFAYPWHRQYDMHPDGRRFLFLRNEEEVTDLTVIVNWMQRQRAATAVR